MSIWYKNKQNLFFKIKRGQDQFSLFGGTIKREWLLPAVAELQQIADTPKDQPLQTVNDHR